MELGNYVTTRKTTVSCYFDTEVSLSLIVLAKTVLSSAFAKSVKHHNETGSHKDHPRRARPKPTSAADEKFI